jgi:hypothetical protein
MRKRSSDELAGLRKAVLRELAELAQGRHRSLPDQMVWRFLQCPEWQQASRAVAQGMAEEQRDAHCTWLSPPAGWLPPLT